MGDGMQARKAASSAAHSTAREPDRLWVAERYGGGEVEERAAAAAAALAALPHALWPRRRELLQSLLECRGARFLVIQHQRCVCTTRLSLNLVPQAR